MFKKLKTPEELNEYIKKNDRILIYGAGRFSYALLQYVSQDSEAIGKIFCIAVSTRDYNLDTVLGVPVCLIEDVSQGDVDGVLVAVFEEKQEEIATNLLSYGFSNTVVTGNVLYAHLRQKTGSLETDILNNTQWIRGDIKGNTRWIINTLNTAAGQTEGSIRRLETKIDCVSYRIDSITRRMDVVSQNTLSLLNIDREMQNVLRESTDDIKNRIDSANYYLAHLEQPDRYRLTDYPTVSVIIPVYNMERFLEKAIYSAMRQTYENIEILIIDDASTDGSKEIAERLAAEDPRIKIFSHNKNNGLSASRNTGLKHAIGKYVCFLDADDYFAPKLIEECVFTAEQNNLEIVTFDAALEHIEGEIFNRNLPDYDRFGKAAPYHVVTGKKFVKSSVSSNSYIVPAWLLFINRVFLSKNNIIFLEGAYFEDNKFHFDCMINARRILYIPKCFYHRLFHSGTIMTSPFDEKKVKSTFQIARGMAETLKEHIEEDQDNFFLLHLIKRQAAIAAYAYNRISCEEQEVRLFLFETMRMGYELLLDSMNSLFALYGIEHQNWLYQLFIFLTQSCHEPRLVLLNAPAHRNIGDYMIVQNMERMLSSAKVGYRFEKYTYPEMQKIGNSLYESFLPEDIILFAGGGYLGSMWGSGRVMPEILEKCKDNRIIIFPQSVYFSKDKENDDWILKYKTTIEHCTDITICTREELSFERAKELWGDFAKIKLMPDVALMQVERPIHLTRSGVLVCLRIDEESALSCDERYAITRIVQQSFSDIFEISMHSEEDIPSGSEHIIIEEKIRQISGAKLVITDALHCMISCALTGTPCIALDNISGKVGGVYEWIKDLPYIKFMTTKELLSFEITEWDVLEKPQHYTMNFSEYERQLLALI